MKLLKFVKDFLIGTFGVVGFGIWFIIGALLMFAPLVFLDISFWVSLLLIIVIMYIPIIGDITNFVIWIWAFVVVLSESIDGWSIAYFIIFGIYILTSVLPTVIQLILTPFVKKENEQRW